MNWFACLLGYLFGTKMNQPICNYGIRLPRNDDHHIVILHTQQQKKILSRDLNVPVTCLFRGQFVTKRRFTHVSFIHFRLII